MRKNKIEMVDDDIQSPSEFIIKIMEEMANVSEFKGIVVVGLREDGYIVHRSNNLGCGVKIGMLTLALEHMKLIAFQDSYSEEETGSDTDKDN